ncbi:MAG: hypothetical protein GXP37_15030 [Chloroflexi bacterium]|nr:hypothetical protein [Chloroflexota bacterium]
MSDLTLQELEQARDAGQLVVWVGADLPVAVTGLPPRSEIALALARRHGLTDSGSLAEIAALIQQGDYRRDLISTLLDAYGSAQPGTFQHVILWLVQEYGLRNIVTTTYDRSLELACDAAGIPYTSIVDDTDLEFADAGQLRIFRLYGHVQRKDRLVITEDDHVRLLSDPQRSAMLATVRQLFQQNTALFLGYNLADLDFKFLLAGRSGQALVRRAFVVWPDCSQQERRMWARRQVIVLDSDPFGLSELPEMAALGDREMPKTMNSVGGQTRGAGGGETLLVPEPPPAPKAKIRLNTLRIDAAVPEQATVNQAFVLAVAIRQPDAPPLQENDLGVVHSGEAQIFVSSDQPYATMRLQVSAPGCDIDGDDSRRFRLPTGHNSPVFYFNLTPRAPGELSIIVELYQEDIWLGSTSLSTEAVPKLVGEVSLNIKSTRIDLRIASLRRQLEDAQLLLASIEEQLAVFPVGAQPPHLALQKRKQEDRIRELEMELDSLLDADNGVG